jgi:hypothetical protein
VSDPEPVGKAHPVDPEVGHLELAAQEVVLELLTVLVALVVYFGLEEFADPGEQRIGIQEENEQRAGKVQSSHTGTPGVYMFRQ